MTEEEKEIFWDSVKHLNEYYGYLEDRVLDRQDFDEESEFSQYRFALWRAVFDDYITLNKQERRELKQPYLALMKQKRDMLSDFIEGRVANATPVYLTVMTSLTEAKENKMYDAKREYLADRACSVFMGKDSELSKKFHIFQDERPKNAKEARERAAAGELKITGDDEAYFFAFEWRKVDADQEGYEKAYDILNKDYQFAKDTIYVADEKDGLAALREFEAKTYN